MAKPAPLFEAPKNTRRCCERCGAEDDIGKVVPYGVGPHVWLHPECWSCG